MGDDGSIHYDYYTIDRKKCYVNANWATNIFFGYKTYAVHLKTPAGCPGFPSTTTFHARLCTTNQPTDLDKQCYPEKKFPAKSGQQNTCLGSLEFERKPKYIGDAVKNRKEKVELYLRFYVTQ